MSLSRRAGSVLALVTIALAACGGSDDSGQDDQSAVATGDPDQSELRKLILQADAPPTPEEVAAAQTGSDTQIKTEGGVSTECVYKRFTGTALYETLVSFDPNADSIWPGAIVQTKTLAEGLAAPIGLDRRPGTITLGDANIIGGASADRYSRTILEPSFATTRDSIAEMFSTGTVKLAAKSNYLAETAYSMNEASVKMGMAASWMNGSVKANFAGSWLTKKTTMIVRFIQAYYTVSFAAPSAPEKVFGAHVTANDAKGYMGPGNPPAFVSSVTYGRMLIMKVETDDSEKNLRAALDVAFSKVSVDVDVSTKNVLQNSTFSVFVLGGSPDDAARIQASDAAGRASALSSYITDGANFDPRSPGVPISYTMRRLSDNGTIKVASTIDYQIPVCTPAAVNVALNVEKFYVHKDGSASGSTTGSYEAWMESSTSAGGAAPPTPGEKDTSNRVSLTKGTAHVNDDTTVTLNQVAYGRVDAQAGQTITIGGHFRTDANGKECDMTRVHTYRFNPTTTKGEWTNTAENTLNCAVSDSSFFGNNSLNVDMSYTFTP